MSGDRIATMNNMKSLGRWSEGSCMGELYSELGRLLSANHADDLAFLVSNDEGFSEDDRDPADDLTLLVFTPEHPDGSWYERMRSHRDLYQAARVSGAYFALDVRTTEEAEGAGGGEAYASALYESYVPVRVSAGV